MFLLRTTKNTNNLLSFNYNEAPGYDLFLDGTDLSEIHFDLKYEVKKKSDLKNLKKFHLIQSHGPEIVSNSLRAVIEEIAPSDVNFFDPEITCGNEIIEGFSAINIKSKFKCLNMDESEYEQRNFDPNNPVYAFSYMKILENLSIKNKIFRCAEHSRYLVVDEDFKNHCSLKGIDGLSFCQAIDMTYGDRSKCEN